MGKHNRSENVRDARVALCVPTPPLVFMVRQQAYLSKLEETPRSSYNDFDMNITCLSSVVHCFSLVKTVQAVMIFCEYTKLMMDVLCVC
jgi:hypothetical protein